MNNLMIIQNNVIEIYVENTAHRELVFVSVTKFAKTVVNKYAFSFCNFYPNTFFTIYYNIKSTNNM